MISLRVYDFSAYKSSTPIDASPEKDYTFNKTHLKTFGDHTSLQYHDAAAPAARSIPWSHALHAASPRMAVNTIRAGHSGLGPPVVEETPSLPRQPRMQVSRG